jgi:hypothetical protein
MPGCKRRQRRVGRWPVCAAKKNTWHEQKWELPAPEQAPTPKPAPRVTQAPRTLPPTCASPPHREHFSCIQQHCRATASAAADTAADSVYAARAQRWAEGAFYRVLIDQMDWDIFVPDMEANRKVCHQIPRLAHAYLTSFDMSTLYRSNAARWPWHLRMWTAECIWSFDELQRRRSLPRNLTHPDIRHIRVDTAAAAQGFSDPGNLRLHAVVHALRLWCYCDPMRVDAVFQLAPGECGTGRNQNGVGPVNRRGIIVEAGTNALQNMGSRAPDIGHMRRRRRAAASSSAASMPCPP